MVVHGIDFALVYHEMRRFPSRNGLSLLPLLTTSITLGLYQHSYCTNILLLLKPSKFACMFLLGMMIPSRDRLSAKILVLITSAAKKHQYCTTIAARRKSNEEKKGSRNIDDEEERYHSFLSELNASFLAFRSLLSTISR